jgi:hypothetical protein
MSPQRVAGVEVLRNPGTDKENVMHSLRWFRISIAAVCLVLGASAFTITAQPAPPAPEKHDAKILRDALKDVVNAGADLFNKDGDHAGCYRLYQGALIAMKPFLGAATQKEIEGALTAAEALPRFSDRAFALRKMINTIRAQAAQGSKG